MGNIWNQLGNDKQKDLIITANLIQNQSRKMPTLMVLGKDGVQDFWLKNLTSLHVRIAEQMTDIMNGRLPPNYVKANDRCSFRVIESLYKFLKISRLPEEKKGCRKGSMRLKVTC